MVLLRVEAIIHAADLGRDSSVLQLPQAGQLIAPDGIALCLDLDGGYLAVGGDHEIGKTVPHAAEIVAHRSEDLGQAVRTNSLEQGPQRADLHVVPGKNPVELSPSGRDSSQDDCEPIAGSKLSQLAVDLRREP